MTTNATNKDAARVAGQIDTPEERKAWYALRNPDNEVVATRLMTDTQLKDAQAAMADDDWRWELRQDQIAIQYPSVDGPIEIKYNERDNEWQFTLRGKDRTAQSLENAKASIDAPVREKARVFKKFEAFLRSGYAKDTRLEKVTVTGLVAGGRGYRTSGKAWVRRANGRRDTAYMNALLQMTPENEALVKQIDELVTQQETLSTQIKALSEKIAPVTITDADYD